MQEEKNSILYLSTYLLFLMLHFFLYIWVSILSLKNIPSISCSAGLLATTSFVYLKMSLSYAHFKRIFHWIWNSSLIVFSFQHFKDVIHCFLASLTRSQPCQPYFCFPVYYVYLSVATLKISSLSLVFKNFIKMCFSSSFSLTYIFFYISISTLLFCCPVFFPF